MAKSPNTTTAPTGHIAPFGLRMLPDLKEQLEVAAKASGRSMNAEIVSRLQESITGGGQALVLDQAKQIMELRQILAWAHLDLTVIASLLERIAPDEVKVHASIRKTMERTAPFSEFVVDLFDVDLLERAKALMNLDAMNDSLAPPSLKQKKK